MTPYLMVGLTNRHETSKMTDIDPLKSAPPPLWRPFNSHISATVLSMSTKFGKMTHI